MYPNLLILGMVRCNELHLRGKWQEVSVSSTFVERNQMYAVQSDTVRGIRLVFLIGRVVASHSLGPVAWKDQFQDQMSTNAFIAHWSDLISKIPSSNFSGLLPWASNL